MYLVIGLELICCTAASNARCGSWGQRAVSALAQVIRCRHEGNGLGAFWNLHFLLIVLREVLPRMKTLKVILMSAALNVQLFYTYFNGCPIISGKHYLFIKLALTMD